jgi:hypothetical protein
MMTILGWFNRIGKRVIIQQVARQQIANIGGEQQGWLKEGEEFISTGIISFV